MVVEAKPIDDPSSWRAKGEGVVEKVAEFTTNRLLRGASRTSIGSPTRSAALPPGEPLPNERAGE